MKTKPKDCFSFGMRAFSVAFLAAGILLSSSGLAQVSFYGPDSVRGMLRFKTHFVTEATYQPKAKKGSDEMPAPKLKSAKQIKEEAVNHTKYLFGVFMYQTYKDKNGEVYDYAEASGATDDSPGADLVVTKKDWFDQSKNLIRVDYEYEDRAVFHDDLWIEYDEIGWIDLKFLMPTKPSSIYEDARSLLRDPKELDKKGKPIATPCTSKYDNSKAAFYYYWSHSWESCPTGFRDFLHEVEADFEPDPDGEDEKTAPLYQKLIDQNKDGVFDATIMYGIDQSFGEKDLGVRGFRAAVRKVRELKGRSGKAIFRELKPNEKLKKTYIFELDSEHLGKTRLHLVLVNPDQKKFTRQARKALRHDVFAYNGHSADGDYFKLKKFFSKTRPRLSKDYQIFFIDSCSSYTFYHANLFQEKPEGSKYLHLVLNVIGAPYLQDDEKDNEFSSPTLEFVLNLILQTEQYAQSKEAFTWKQHLDSFMNVISYDYSGMPVFLGQDD